MSKHEEQVVNLIFANGGKVCSPLHSNVESDDSLSHKFRITNGVEIYEVVITMRLLDVNPGELK